MNGRIIPREMTEVVKMLFSKYPIITITGPRQSGKTTFVRYAFPDLDYVNLEDMEERRFAQEDPKGFLRSHAGGAVIDEIQNVPELSSWLQVDVIYEVGGMPFPVEIKAGATLNSDYFRGLRYFLERVAEPNPYTDFEGLLVYAGDRDEQRSSIKVTHPSKLAEALSSLEKRD